MATERISVEDLMDDFDNGNVTSVFVSREYGWCELKGYAFGFYSGKVALTFSVSIGYSGLYPLGTVFTKMFRNKKTFRIYE